MIKSYGSYLEELRTSRNISRADFVEGIMSERQYRRYVKGESSITNEKLQQLVDKLRLDLFSFMNGFEERTASLDHSIKEVYNLIRKLDYKKALDLHSKISVSSLYKRHQRDLYAFNDVSIKYKLNMVSKRDALEKLYALIDYPNCLNEHSVSTVKLATLTTILSIAKSEDVYLPVGKFLYNILISNLYTAIGNQRNFMPSIFSTTARLLFITGHNKEAYAIALKGIEYCDTIESTNSINNILLIAALSANRLGMQEKKDVYLTRLRHCLSFKGDTEYSNQFEKEIKRLLI